MVEGAIAGHENRYSYFSRQSRQPPIQDLPAKQLHPCRYESYYRRSLPSVAALYAITQP